MKKEIISKGFKFYDYEGMRTVTEIPNGYTLYAVDEDGKEEMFTVNDLKMFLKHFDGRNHDVVFDFIEDED